MMTIDERVAESNKKAKLNKLIAEIYHEVENSMKSATMHGTWNNETNEIDYTEYDKDEWGYDDAQEKKQAYNAVLKAIDQLVK